MIQFKLLSMLHTFILFFMLPSVYQNHNQFSFTSNNTQTHTRLMALFSGLPRSAGTRKVKPIWILPKQETVSGSGISWAICKSAPCSRQTTTPAPYHSVLYRPDALPAAQPIASKHWSNKAGNNCLHIKWQSQVPKAISGTSGHWSSTARVEFDCQVTSI